MTYRLKQDPAPPKSATETSTPPSPDKPTSNQSASGKKPVISRLVSLDAFRGLIMIMLAANGFGIYQLSRTDAESPLWSLLDHESFERFAFHFEHPPWQSQFLIGSMDASEGSAWLKWKVSFWDLIQPAFMMMVGMAMPFSYARRAGSGQSPLARGVHALIRAIVLVLLGVFLYSRGEAGTNWIFTNVLAQIGLGYFFVYLLLGRSTKVQLACFVLILVGTTLGMQFIPAPVEFVPEEVNASVERGEIFAEPYRRWSKNGNAFHDFDTWFLNLFPRPGAEDSNRFEFNRGGYTTLNFLPSIATMLLGVFVGQFVLVAPRNWSTLGKLVLAGILLVGLGVVASASCCPIVKRIWTPAWVLFSGGYVIGIFALCYMLFDLLPFQKLAFPLVVVGMNSIFVYMAGQMLRPWIYQDIVTTHFQWLIDWFFQLFQTSIPPDELQQIFEPVVRSTAVFLVIWLACLWLYRQRIFIRI